MINGHGDDIYKYNDVRCNFSSNIYAGFSHHGLFDHLRKTVHLITNYPEIVNLSFLNLLFLNMRMRVETIVEVEGFGGCAFLIIQPVM